MSSYRSSYVSWKGGSSSLGASSYSPASSTSSLASSTSTGGSSTGKYGSSTSSYKGLESKLSSSSSREPSFISSSSGSSSSTAGKLASRYSSLSSKVDSLSSSTSGGFSSATSNLSSTTKSFLSPSKDTTTTSKSSTSGLSHGYGLASVSNIASKFSSPISDTPSSSSYRSSLNLRSATSREPSSGDATASKSTKLSSLSDNPKQPSSSSTLSTKTEEKVPSSTNTTNATGGSSSSYRPFSSRLGSSSSNTTTDFGSSTAASSASSILAPSSFRSTRFGIRSHPSPATLKAAAVLAEETKKELMGKGENSKPKTSSTEGAGEVTWMNRGTITDSDDKSDTCISGGGISQDEIPSFKPRVFSSRYDGVLKHRAVQTEEEPVVKPKLTLPSSIPRPTLSLNYYNKYGTKNQSQPQQLGNESPEDKSTTDSSNTSSKPNNVKIVGKVRVGSVKEKSNATTTPAPPNSTKATISDDAGAGNNGVDSTSTTTMTSGSDQSSRSSQQQAINKKIAVESGVAATSNCNNGHVTQEESSSNNSKTTRTNSISSPKDAPAGVVFNVANKEFRKSALNVELETKDEAEQFAKKQEQLRLQKGQSQLPPVNTDDASDDKGKLEASDSAAEVKRDSFKIKPPTETDSSKSNAITNARFNLRRSSADLNNANDTNNNNKSSPPSLIQGLKRMKSSKNINEMRKLSTGSISSNESESCSNKSSRSSSVSGASVKEANNNINNHNDAKTKVKKTINNSSTADKGQNSRRESVASLSSGSSAASSRSSSVERSVSLSVNANNSISGNNNKKVNSIQSLNKISVNSNSNSDNPPPPLPSSKPPSGASNNANKSLAGKSNKIVKPKEGLPPTSKPSTTSTKSSDVGQAKTPIASAAAQSSFMDRLANNDKPWVRKCQSGELPWWLKSNQDVPSILGKTASKSSISKEEEQKVEDTKDAEEEEEEEESSSSSELSDEEEFEPVVVNDLGERTEPDGVETFLSESFTKNGSASISRKSSVCSASRGGSRKGSILISNIENIDDILGNVTEAPSPAPTPTPPTVDMEELYRAQRRLSLKDDNKDEEESEDDDSSTTSDVVADQFDKTQVDDESEEEEEDDDNASVGTSSSFEEVDPASVKDSGVSTMEKPTTSEGRRKSETAEQETLQRRRSTASGTMDGKLDDATFQIYKDGEFGSYLDLDATIGEQSEDFEGFHENRKNSIVLRAQLPVRVHAIIEKLLTADGRELRRALFSLKQIFQEDKDLVHEFVENGGLNCLIKVGSDADQNYQNYILRAIGQVMLYVDGMYGVMRHNETIQWLYTLVASKFRLVQKTALKLLLVFVDYDETNCLLLVQAVTTVDHNRGLEAWLNIMNLLREQDSNSGDTELLVYAMTLVNKVLNAVPDIDTYYDQVDALEEQGMANIIQSYMGKQCADLDLLKQFQIYELVLKHEDGEEDNIMLQLDETMRNKLLNRKGYNETEGSSNNNKDRRKSRRYSTSTTTSTSTTPPTTPNGSYTPAFPRRLSSADASPFSSLSSSSSIGSLMQSASKEKGNLELTPGLRRRRERAEHQKSLILEQLVTGTCLNGDSNGLDSPPTAENALELQNNLKNSTTSASSSPSAASAAARPWMLPIYTKSGSSTNVVNGCDNGEEANALKRENTVKDLTQKLASQNLLAGSPAEENKSFIITGELSGVVSKAKEGLAKSKSRVDMKPQSNDSSGGNKTQLPAAEEVKKSDNELHWDFLVNNLSRPLEICDLDFTDLKTTDDEDILAPDPHSHHFNFMNGGPPPAPMMLGMNGHPPPPPPGKYAPPPPLNGFSLTSPHFGVNLKKLPNSSTTPTKDTNSTKATAASNKTKKTVKLFWKEIREDPITASKVQKVGCIWTEIVPTEVDTERLEALFESRAKDLICKKQSDANKSKEIVVLDPKRSNAINIAMTKLPPPRTIKAAINKMDSTIINREGIEKLLAMLPTEEERAKITEAQFANPETPLGSAEQFLLTLSSISELTPRLKLWAFKLDYENLEREVAEPLMDLKTGIVVLEKNKTFRFILATLLSIGNFLNGSDAKGFHIEYLSKVPEVKDTVQKHSLLHHLCQTVNENYPDSTDLYSEIGPVTRASRVDFDEIGTNLAKMESDCKTSWDHLRVIAKHDGPTNLKLKLSEFLADCAERIIVLGIINKRVMNRFHKFLLWLGVAAHQVSTTKPHTLFKVVSEFALEYRTTRERVIQQMQKKASHRERNKTRGKMITEGRPQEQEPCHIMYKSKEDQEDAELREVLKKTTNGSDEVVRGSLTWTRRLKPPTTPTTPTTLYHHSFQNGKSATLNGHSNGALGDGDDEILESLVKTATRTPDSRVLNRERKRNNGLRNSAETKSLRRTLRHGLTEEERKMLAAFMATGHPFCT